MQVWASLHVYIYIDNYTYIKAMTYIEQRLPKSGNSLSSTSQWHLRMISFFTSQKIQVWGMEARFAFSFCLLIDLINPKKSFNILESNMNTPSTFRAKQFSFKGALSKLFIIILVRSKLLRRGGKQTWQLYHLQCALKPVQIGSQGSNHKKPQKTAKTQPPVQ